MFHQDLPIENSAQDIFNRSNYAKNLAEALLKSQYKSSFVVGLYGSWGSGKTSLCNMILEKVKEVIDKKEKQKQEVPEVVQKEISSQLVNSDEKIVIFQFNPWLCSNVNQLINQFFIQLGATLQIKNKNFASIAKSIFNYAEIISNLSSPLIPISGYITKFCSWSKEKCSKNEKKKKTIQNIKNDIIMELKQQNIKLFITIDDIDRLSEQEIVAVFQLVKALGDFPNTIYFLCFDHEIVTTALDKIHTNKGQEYLEKIVQMTITLPVISTAILENIFTEKIKNILDNRSIIKFNNEKYSKLVEILLKNYITNIRDITRFENTFMLKYNLLKDVTDPVDLLAISSLELFEANFFVKLYYLKSILFEPYFMPTRKQLIEERNKEINFILEKTLTQNKKAIYDILLIIFPRMLAENGEYEETASQSLIISNKEYFDRYFDLSITESTFSYKYIYEVLTKNSYDFIKELDKLNLKQNLSIFLKELLMFLQSPKNINLSREIAVKICKELCLEWNKFKLPCSGLYGFMGNRLSLILFELLSYLTKEEQEQFLVTCIFENPNVHPSTLGTIFLRLKKLYNKDNYYFIRKNIFITNNQLQKLEKIFIMRSIETLNIKEKLLEYNGLDFIMLFLGIIKEKKINEDEYHTKIKELSFMNELIIPIFRWSINYIAPEKVKIYIQRLKIFMTNQEALEKATTLTCDKSFLMYDSETQFILIIILLALTNNINITDEDDYFITFEQIHMKLEEIKNSL